MAALKQGYLQVYTGDGKGKTTAALGAALRASGRGLRVFFGQFMKGQFYGEHRALLSLPSVVLKTFGGPLCIRREDVTGEDRERARDGLNQCRQAMLSGDFDLVVLDEVNVALWFRLIGEGELKEFLDLRPPRVELILTGRWAPRWLVERADLTTEMRLLKHYYDSGVEARDGIER